MAGGTGTCFDTASPWAQSTLHGPVLRADDISLGVCVSDGLVVNMTAQSASGRVAVAAGQRHVIGVVASRGEPLMLSTAADVDDGLDRTIDVWRNSSNQFEYSGPWQETVQRSVLILKMLIHNPTGSIAAAATTSLPERYAGGKNWDYRFASGARRCLHTVSVAPLRYPRGNPRRAQLAAAHRASHGPHMDVFFKLDGSEPPPVQKYEAPGWRGIGPVVTGNRAERQMQLSIFADLFDTVRLYVDNGHVLDTETAHLLTGFADQACDAWRRRDAGMWELPQQEHYTSSKIGCWQALRCAVHLAESGQIPGDSERWANEAERISDWVLQHCWSDSIKAFEWYPGSGQLDASILLHAGSGFDRGPQLSATPLDALKRELGERLLYRFSGAREDGEGAFLASLLGGVGPASRRALRRSPRTDGHSRRADQRCRRARRNGRSQR